MVKKLDYFKRCCGCGCQIEAGEHYYDFDGDEVCEECVNEYIDDNFRRQCVSEDEDYIADKEGEWHDERDY